MGMERIRSTWCLKIKGYSNRSSVPVGRLYLFLSPCSQNRVKNLFVRCLSTFFQYFLRHDSRKMYLVLVVLERFDFEVLDLSFSVLKDGFVCSLNEKASD